MIPFKKILRTQFIILFTLVSGRLMSQDIPVALQALLDHTLDSMHTEIGAKSFSAAIEFPNNYMWSAAAGISSQVPLVQATPQHVYLIGSITKTMTSACILQLAEEGLLSIDDSLYEWVETINYINPNITIRQLLRHQSGLYDVLLNPNCEPTLLSNMDSIWSSADLINTFIQPPLFQPGEGWSYCNTNYFLLGMIIKEATGNEFYEELRSRFFTPLSMNTIAVPAFEDLNSPVAHVWMDLNGDQAFEDANFLYSNYLSLNSAVTPAGGYYSTASDISHWMRSYMRGDVLLSSSMDEAIETVPAPGLPSCTYGLGLMKRSFIGFQGYGHGGDLAYASSSWYFPAKDLSITVFTNDAQFNSWTLIPVVTALLRTIDDWDQLAAGVAEKSTAEIIVYPNPIQDEITIRLPEDISNNNFTLTLTDIFGKTIKNTTQNGLSGTSETYSIRGLESLTTGIYFLTISGYDYPLRTFKIVK
jgi:D-alanyl-D-alanine carboxypeptidase